MNDADDPRIDGYNARTIRELDAERARPPHDCAASIQINNDLAERLDYWQMGYIGLEARHAALVAAARDTVEIADYYARAFVPAPLLVKIAALRAALDGEPR